jgi:ketosteroid isomerase-like protein
LENVTMPWTEQEAVAFVEHHIEVWNRHDLEEILQLYTEDVELVSPFAGQVVGRDVVRGREGLREYFGTALARNPNLEFEIVDVLRCVDSVTIYMRSVGGRMVAEVLFVNDEGLISKVLAHYTCSAA